jgi:hypothetical protein
MSLHGAFGPREKAYLQSRYREGPTITDWPCGVHHHFERDYGYLWLMGSEWMAGATGEWSMKQLTRDVWWLVSGDIEAWEEETTASMVRQLKSEPPAYPGPGWDAVFGDDLAARFRNGLWRHSAHDDALIPPALDELLDTFDEVRRGTPGAGLTAHWLQRGGQRLYIITEDHREQGAAAAWWLHADSAEELDQLQRHVWRWGRLAETLRSR